MRQASGESGGAVRRQRTQATSAGMEPTAAGASVRGASSAVRRRELAATTLGVNLAVILWGAFVRATGSGAGCGSHWPLCNGELVPRAPTVATQIELGHRLSSGFALLLVVGIVMVARGLPRGAPYRRAAWASLGLILTEALIGAGLVLLEHVADDLSVARGWWMAGHLINTFLLLGGLALTVWFAGAAGEPSTRSQVDEGSPQGRGQSARSIALAALALGGVLLLGVSGAITALGDTLFPVTSLEQGRALTFSPDAHLFVRLRIWHPLIALVVGGLIVLVTRPLVRASSDPAAPRLRVALVVIYAAQLGVGLADVRWLAPVWLQLVHLLLADLIWILLVWLVATVFWPAPRRGRREVTVGAVERIAGTA